MMFNFGGLQRFGWLIWGVAGLLCCLGCEEASTPAADLGPVTLDGRNVDKGKKVDKAVVVKKDGPVPDLKVKPDQPKLPAHWKLVSSSVLPEISDHTATKLQGGQVLIAGGGTYINGKQLYQEMTHSYLPVQGKFAQAGKMVEGRIDHTATLLDNGKVLVTGGTNDRAYLDTTEIYDPKAAIGKAWTKGPPMAASRWSHAAIWVPSIKKVLVSGGFGSYDSISTVALYDVAGNRWQTPAMAMNKARRGHTMTLLKSGKVLIVGGMTGKGSWSSWKSNDTMEIYDPASGSFKLVAKTMARGRVGHTVTLMADGRVLIVGGVCWGSDVCKNAEAKNDIFNPQDGSVTHIAHPGSSSGLPSAHVAALLADRRVMVCGSNKETKADQVIAFNPSGGGIWDTLPTMKIGRWSATATRLNDLTVLVVGGVHKSGPYTYAKTAEIYVP